jgi:transcriptional regulator of acetoin/glycerol metabolism
MLLHALGDASFRTARQRVALRPGAIWHEQWRGTNAIGTALAEGAPVVVHGGEHYLERNGFLTCAAAPIIDPAGRLLGALDISGDQRGYHRHTLGLVRSAARMIEHRLFEARTAASLRLRLHPSPRGWAPSPRACWRCRRTAG